MAVELIPWWLALQAMAIAVWPLTRGLFKRLGDAGWGLAKVCGLALVGLIHWQACYYGLWSNDAAGIWLALGAALVLSLVWTRGSAGPWKWLARHWRYALIVELVFLAAFLGWAWLRSAAPGLTHTEQPMDMMILSSIWVSPQAPPQDAWLAGYGLSYYYLGHWFMAAVGRLAAVGPALSYNIGQCAWFALVVTGCLSLGRNLALSLGLGRWRAWTAGVLAVLAACFSGNIKAALLATGIMDKDPSWWFNATRVIVDHLPGGKTLSVIDEFPFFSFYLGDNHAHVLALPLSLLIISLALSAALAPRPEPGASRIRSFFNTFTPLPGGFILVLILASLPLAANAWDCAGLWPLLILAVFIGSWGGLTRRTIMAVVAALALVLVAALTCLPYLATTESPLSGAINNLFTPSDPVQLLMAMGLPLVGALTLLFSSWPTLRPDRRLLAMGAALTFGIPLAALLGSSLARSSMGLWWRQPVSFFIIGLPLVLGAAMLLKNLDREKPHQGWSFAVLLAMVGLALIMAPEVVYLRDAFGARMNTAFKFHYQAWLMLAIAGGVGAASWRGVPGKLTAGLWVALVFFGLSYAAVLSWPLLKPHQPQSRTLDPIKAIEHFQPDLAKTIRWIQANTEPGQAIIQAKGKPYHWADNAISSFTGRPAPMGWLGHQWQWRGGKLGPRLKMINTALVLVYKGFSAKDMLTAAADLGGDMVLVSPKERRVYHLPPYGHTLSRLGHLMFKSGEYELYRLTNQTEEQR